MVKAELEINGFEIRSIRILKDELPMFMVTLPKDPTSKHVFNLPDLFFVTILSIPHLWPCAMLKMSRL